MPLYRGADHAQRLRDLMGDREEPVTELRVDSIAAASVSCSNYNSASFDGGVNMFEAGEVAPL